MPYVGNPLADAFSSREKQDLTGQSGTSFTLSHAVSHANDLSVYINHVRQEPTTAYSVNGTTLTTTGSVAGTDDFYIIYDELAVQSISHPTNQALTATAGTFTSGLVGTTATFSGALSATTGTFSGAVDIQGQELILDADNDTSITADTDDEIHFKVAGSDHVKIKGGTNVLHVIEGSSGQGTPHTNSALVLESDGETGINILSGNTNFGGIVFGDDGDADIGFIQYKHDDNYIRFGTNTSERMRINSDGRVGIGVAGESGVQLEINAPTTVPISMRTDGGNGNNRRCNLSAYASGGTYGGGFILETRNSSNIFSEAMRVDFSGAMYLQNVYDDTTSFGANMYIHSDGVHQVLRSTSSERYKKNIETLEDKYADAVLGLRPVWYKSKCEADNADHSHWGLIAEEVAKVDPRLVTFRNEYTEDIGDGKWKVVKLDAPQAESVQYDRLVPHLINICKRQEDKITALEAKVKTLEEA